MVPRFGIDHCPMGGWRPYEFNDSAWDTRDADYDMDGFVDSDPDSNDNGFSNDIFTWGATDGPQVYGNVTESEAFQIAMTRGMVYAKEKAAELGIDNFYVGMNGSGFFEEPYYYDKYDGQFFERIRRFGDGAGVDLQPRTWSEFESVIDAMSNMQNDGFWTTWEIIQADIVCTDTDSLYYYSMGAGLLTGSFSAWVTDEAEYNSGLSRRDVLAAPVNPTSGVPVGDVSLNQADSSAVRAYSSGDTIKLKWNGTIEDCAWDWAVFDISGNPRYLFPGERNYWDQFEVKPPTLTIPEDVSTEDLTITFLPVAKSDSVVVEIATDEDFTSGQDSLAVIASDSSAVFADAVTNKYYVRAKSKRFYTYSAWSDVENIQYTLPATELVAFNISNPETTAAGDSLQVDVFGEWSADVSTRLFLTVLDSAYADSTGKGWTSANDYVDCHRWRRYEYGTR